MLPIDVKTIEVGRERVMQVALAVLRAVTAGRPRNVHASAWRTIKLPMIKARVNRINVQNMR